MIYLNNFDLLKEREQLHNICSFYMNTSKQVKSKKKSSENQEKYYSEINKKIFEKTNIMTSNIFNETVSNVIELTSSSAQILIQMQTCIEQLEEQY